MISKILENGILDDQVRLSAIIIRGETPTADEIASGLISATLPGIAGALLCNLIGVKSLLLCAVIGGAVTIAADIAVRKIALDRLLKETEDPEAGQEE